MNLHNSKLLQEYSQILHTFTDASCGNLAFHVNDDTKKVIANHQKLAAHIGYDLDKLVYMKQIHSDRVHIVYGNDDFTHPPICDALITDKIDTPLMVMVADCAPILFYDSKQNVIAVAHAGRVGAFKNIVQNVINTFLDNYKSNIEDILISIGPSIHECCYEVGSEILKEAKKLNLEYAIKQREGNFYLNILDILLEQLLDAGVEKSNIEVSNTCTQCHNKEYFSYRHNKNTGRFAALIYLKN